MERRKSSRNDEQTSEIQEDTPFSTEKTMIYTLTDTPEMILKAETEKENEREGGTWRRDEIEHQKLDDGRKEILEKRTLLVGYKKPRDLQKYFPPFLLSALPKQMDEALSSFQHEREESKDQSKRHTALRLL